MYVYVYVHVCEFTGLCVFTGMCVCTDMSMCTKACDPCVCKQAWSLRHVGCGVCTCVHRHVWVRLDVGNSA